MSTKKELEQQVSEYFDMIAELDNKVDQQSEIIYRLSLENIKLKKQIKSSAKEEQEKQTKQKDEIPMYDHLKVTKEQ